MKLSDLWAAVAGEEFTFIVKEESKIPEAMARVEELVKHYSHEVKGNTIEFSNGGKVIFKPMNGGLKDKDIIE